MLLLMITAVFAVSCDLESLFEDAVQDAAGTLFPSTDGSSGLKDFRFGVIDSDGEFVPWHDSLTMAAAGDRLEDMAGNLQIDWGQVTSGIYQRVEYDEIPDILKLELIPADAVISTLSVVSSDPSILKVSKGETFFDFRLETFGVGDVTLTVKVGAGTATAEKKYKVRVKEVLDLVIYIDEFWTNPSLSKVRYLCADLPPKVDALALTVKDSMAVDAVCRWRDVADGVYEEQEETITYEFGTRSRDRVFREGMRCLIRDFSDALDHFSTKYVYGTEFVSDTDEVCEMKYEYYPAHARLFLDVCSSSPYLDFRVITRGSGIVSSDNDFAQVEGEEMKDDPEAMEHFQVSFCADMSDEEMQGMYDELSEKLGSLGSGTEDMEWREGMFEGMSEEEIAEFIRKLKEGASGKDK